MIILTTKRRMRQGPYLHHFLFDRKSASGLVVQFLRRPYDVILELAGIVVFKRGPIVSRHRLRQRVFERNLAVDVGLELRTGDGHLQVMPKGNIVAVANLNLNAPLSRRH
jgi:hypothetical protein